MRIDPFFLRGVIITFLATVGLIYEVMTDREPFVLIFYVLLVVVGAVLILRVRS